MELVPYIKQECSNVCDQDLPRRAPFAVAKSSKCNANAVYLSIYFAIIQTYSYGHGVVLN